MILIMHKNCLNCHRQPNKKYPQLNLCNREHINPHVHFDFALNVNIFCLDLCLYRYNNEYKVESPFREFVYIYVYAVVSIRFHTAAAATVPSYGNLFDCPIHIDFNFMISLSFSFP